MRVLGLILAGGKSSRMGENKAFIKLDDKTLIEHVYERIRPQCESVLVSTNSNNPYFAGFQTVPDSMSGQPGPLAGILAGLEAAQHIYEWLVTTPVDCPFLPVDLVEKLGGRFLLPPLAGEDVRRTDEVYSNNKITLACSNNQLHYTTGLWHISLIKPLKRAIDYGICKVQDFTQSHNSQYIQWHTSPIDPFFNINTQADLAIASAALNSASATPM